MHRNSVVPHIKIRDDEGGGHKPPVMANHVQSVCLWDPRLLGNRKWNSSNIVSSF